MKAEATLSVADLRGLVALNADSGSMTWLPREPRWFAHLGADADRAMASWNTRHAFREAFAHRSGNGYLHGSLLGEKVLAHRVVWALSTGGWPLSTIDHINGDRHDNRPANLRDVPHQQNCRNQPRSKANKTGVTGVSFNTERQKFEATATVGGKTVHLGKFSNLDEAAAARAAANPGLGFHANHGRQAA